MTFQPFEIPGLEIMAAWDEPCGELWLGFWDIADILELLKATEDWSWGWDQHGTVIWAKSPTEPERREWTSRVIVDGDGPGASIYWGSFTELIARLEDTSKVQA